MYTQILASHAVKFSLVDFCCDRLQSMQQLILKLAIFSRSWQLASKLNYLMKRLNAITVQYLHYKPKEMSIWNCKMMYSDVIFGKIIL